MTNQLLHVSAGDASENSDTSMDACKAAKVKSEIPEEDLGGKLNCLSRVLVTPIFAWP